MRRKSKLTNLRPTSEVCLNSSIQNAAQTLLANIRFSAVDNPISVISVTSSIPNEGKTTVALSLAVAIARSGAKCLIIEGDMRRRSMKSVVGAKPRHGIYALMSGSCTYKEALTSTSFDNISFLDAEVGIPNPDALLSSTRFTQLIETLRKHFHFIIIDTPPVTAFADAAIISSHTDGTIVVAREGYTERRELEFAVNQLRAADANILGVVMNAQSGSDSSGYGYYYGYYYDEYKESGDKPQSSGVAGKASSAVSALKDIASKQVASSSTPKFGNTTKSHSQHSAFVPATAAKDKGSDLADKRERWRKEQDSEWEGEAEVGQHSSTASAQAKGDLKHRIPSFIEVINTGKGSFKTGDND